MSRNNWIRLSHRWTSALFMGVVVVVTILNATGTAEGLEWVNYVPLPFLFILMGTGLYLFALPYVARFRKRHAVEEPGRVSDRAT
jgi:hypothetical protein